MLLGEAQKRERMGIDTVLVSQYGACSDTCLPWQGLVYIDDVWQPYSGDHTPGGSYGVSRNGRSYMLLSVAVKAGLFHPNCRHTVGTWIEGVSRRPQPMDKAKIEAVNKLEAKQRRMELKVREDKRLVEGTQDPDQVKAYKAAPALPNGHQVGQNLAGMGVIRQAVDHYCTFHCLLVMFIILVVWIF